MISTQDLNTLVDEIVTELRKKTTVEIEASARHIHLDRPTIDALFGKGYELTPKKPLSQPGQYVSEERLNIVGPNGKLDNVAILGPARGDSQVELSLTDALTLGLKAPLRESGHLDNTPGVTLECNGKSVDISDGVIIAQRHVHMTPEDATLFGVKNGEIVQVKVDGSRGLIFDNVVIRVSKNYSTRMHVDFDEANACGLTKGMRGAIYKK